MKFNNYDLCLITDEKERLYFLGFNSSAGYILLSKDKTTFVVDSRYFYAAKERLEKKGIEVICGSGYSTLLSEVERLNVKTIGIDYSITTIDQYETFKKLMPNVKFVNVEEELQMKAAHKSEEELNNVQIACDIAEKSFFETIKNLKVGMTEMEVAAELEYRFRINGATDKSFDTIVGFGANSAVPHHETGTTKLTENSIVLIDFGCIYNGYCSDMTRTFFFGNQKPDAKFLDAYKAVYDAHMAGYKSIRSGMTGDQADGIARSILEERGYGQYFTHSLGHGIGVHIHEYPWLAHGRDKIILEDTMVFSNEPGVYFDGQFGIRIEDSTRMINGTVKTFMKDDKRLLVVHDGKVEKYDDIKY